MWAIAGRGTDMGMGTMGMVTMGMGKRRKRLESLRLSGWNVGQSGIDEDEVLFESNIPFCIYLRFPSVHNDELVLSHGERECRGEEIDKKRRTARRGARKLIDFSVDLLPPTFPDRTSRLSSNSDIITGPL